MTGRWLTVSVSRPNTLGVVAALLVGAFSIPAHAQAVPEGFDAHGFNLVAHDADLRDPLTVQRPGAFDQGEWFASALSEYAQAPLVRVLGSEFGTDETVSPLLDNLLVFNVSAGIAAHERLRFDVVAPVIGLSAVPGEARGPTIGDVRGAFMLVGLRPDRVLDGGGFGLALVGHLDFPTGSVARYLGQGAFAGGGKVAATYEWSPITLTADFGAQFNPSTDLLFTTTSDTLLAGLAFGVRASDTVGITLEGTSKPPLFLPPGGLTTLPPIETILSMRYAHRTGGFFTVGAAGGLTDGPGVASFRAFIGGGYGHREALPTRDIDTVGLLRASDLCPLEAETFNGWKDDDGCPDRLGTLGIDVKFRGESRSSDAEITGPDGPQNLRIGPQGLALDAVPGSQWTVKAKDGCLSGEGTAIASEAGTKLIIEMQARYDAKLNVEVIGPKDNALGGALVAWRSEKPECVPVGTALADSTGHITQEVAAGQHRLVVTAAGHNVVEEPIELKIGDHKTVRIKLAASKILVDRSQIKILEKVQFETGKSMLRSVSYGLLNEVASFIINTPEAGRVEVAGHTDNRGPDDFNLELSRDRAFSVRDYLIGQGVPRDRLVAMGYGETRPIDTNKTDGGREANRRVDFNLIDNTGATP